LWHLCGHAWHLCKRMWMLLWSLSNMYGVVRWPRFGFHSGILFLMMLPPLIGCVCTKKMSSCALVVISFLLCSFFSLFFSISELSAVNFQSNLLIFFLLSNLVFRHTCIFFLLFSLLFSSFFFFQSFPL